MDFDDLPTDGTAKIHSSPVAGRPSYHSGHFTSTSNPSAGTTLRYGKSKPFKKPDYRLSSARWFAAGPIP